MKFILVPMFLVLPTRVGMVRFLINCRDISMRSPHNAKLSFIEHYVPRDQGGRVYARDYKGADPAFVLMHGFPDNLHIYDDLVPYLVAGGRRVVTFDFLGFGGSDKPDGAVYSFKQQLGDPVAHDSSGLASINYALAHPAGVDSVIMLNSAYAEDSTVLWPEMITLFATKSLHALAMAIAQMIVIDTLTHRNEAFANSRIEYWHQAPITKLRIMARQSQGAWHDVRWDGKTATSSPLNENG